MKRISYIYIGLAFLATTACSESGSDGPESGAKIQLSATVGNLQIGSRAGNGMEADPFIPQDGEMEAAVWFSNTSGTYLDAPKADTNIPVHTTVTFENVTTEDSKLEYVEYNGNALEYPVDKSSVYCVGMYPATGWSTTDGNTVTHAINGSDDLMFAPQIEGRWDSHFGKQSYSHKLTWIKVNICATSHDAIDAWGKIEQIYITSDSEVKVNLADGTCEYSSKEMIPVMATPTALTTSANEVGSVFCSPETKYSVLVLTRNKDGNTETRTIELTLNKIDVNDGDKVTDVVKEEDATGYCFVFSLYFTPHKVIEGICTLNSWSNQNEDIYVN